MSETKPKTIGIIALIAATICLVFGANAWKSSLKVKQIQVEGNRIIGTNEIKQLAQLQLGTLLYKADLTAMQKNIMSHYYIKDAVVQRNLPNTIHIQVVERIPIGIINRNEALYVDENGIILPRTISHKLFDLPLISGIASNQSLTLGSTLTQTDATEALLLLAILKQMNRAMYHNISEVQLRNGGDIVLYSAEGGVPIIFGRGGLADKLVRFESFWNEIVRARGSQYLQYVDLRYQDQIVACWNPEPSTTKKM